MFGGWCGWLTDEQLLQPTPKLFVVVIPHVFDEAVSYIHPWSSQMQPENQPLEKTIKKQNSTWNSHFYPFFRFHSFNFWAVYSTMWQPKDASCHREAGLFGIDQSHGTLGGSNWGSAGEFYFPDTQCIHYLPTWMVKICGKCRKTVETIPYIWVSGI